MILVMAKQPRVPMRWTITILLCLCLRSTTWPKPCRLYITDSQVSPRLDLFLHVCATDENDRPVRSLGPEHFTVLVDEKPEELISLGYADSREPISVLIAIDVSRSITGPRFAAMKDAACKFVDRLDDKDRVAVIAFGESTRTLVEYNAKSEDIQQAIRSLLATDRRTLLYSAIVECTDKAVKALSARSVVMLFSDGWDDGSRTTMADAIGYARSAQVPFYTVVCDCGGGSDALARLSTATGGDCCMSLSAYSPSLLYDKVLESVWDRYVLEIGGPFSAGHHVVKVIGRFGDAPYEAQHSVSVPLSMDPEGRRRLHIVVGLLIAGLLVLVLFVLLLVRRDRLRSGASAREHSAWPDAASEDKEGLIRMDGNSLSDQRWIPVGGASQSRDESVLGQRGTGVWLEVARGPHKGRRMHLTGRATVIGRDACSDLALVGDFAASRQNAVLKLDADGRFVLRNLQSDNGWRLNGNSLSETSVHLRDGDRISCGNTEIVFRDTRFRSI